MAQETREAPQVVAHQLDANRETCMALGERLRADPPSFVVTCARGSSDHAATFAKYLTESHVGLMTASAAPSVSSVYKTRQKLDQTLFIAISQSGKSPDLLAQARAARESGARVVALVNDASSPLAELSHVCLPLHAGPERSVAATKSFIASISALLQLIAHWSEDEVLLDALTRLPDQLTASAGLDWGTPVEALASANNLLVIGRGLGFGIAQEAALKFKETSELHAEAFSAAELMHGPVALVGSGFPVLVFSQQDATRSGVRVLVERLEEIGAQVWVAEEGTSEPERLPIVHGVHPACAPLLMIQSFYGLANRVALARGLDPDQPRHLRKITETQ
jgi:glucosamine--fructose-6-phosphate aminotransferase (isomerizing)